MKMESQYNAKATNNELIESGPIKDVENELAVANQMKINEWDLFMRVAAVVHSLAAAVVLGVDKQTTVVEVTPAMKIPVTAKWQYQPALVYFMLANVVACAYGAISIAIILARGGAKRRIATMIVVFDLSMVTLLSSGLGGSVAVGIISSDGNSHAHWDKVCNIVGKFCRQSSAAVGLSAVASVVFFMLVFGAIFLNIHKKN